MSKIRSLLLVGASVRAIAESGQRCGFRCWGIDLFGDVDTRRACRLKRVKQLSEAPAALPSEAIDGWLYTGALENYPLLIRKISRRVPLLGCCDRVVQRVRNPLQLTSALSSIVPTVPRTCDHVPVPDEPGWLRKPLASASGRDISKGPFAQATGPRGYYYQQFVDGIPCSAVYLGNGNTARLIGATRQIIGKTELGCNGFRYCGSIGPLDLTSTKQAALETIGHGLVAEFQLSGIFGVDYIDNARGIWPLEVNPRYPASAEILELAANLPLAAWHVQACQSDRLPEPLAADWASRWGKAIVFSRSTQPISISPSISQRLLEMKSSGDVADIPLAGETVEFGAPVVTVFACGRSDENVWMELLRIAAHVRNLLKETAR